MIKLYNLGKIYEFSNDVNFINRTVGVLVKYKQKDEKYRFEYFPLLEEHQIDIKHSSYCREINFFNFSNYSDLFGTVRKY